MAKTKAHDDRPISDKELLQLARKGIVYMTARQHAALKRVTARAVRWEVQLHPERFWPPRTRRGIRVLARRILLRPESFEKTDLDMRRKTFARNKEN